MREDVLRLPQAGAAREVGKHHEGDQLVARQLAEDSFRPAGSGLVSGFSLDLLNKELTRTHACGDAATGLLSVQVHAKFSGDPGVQGQKCGR